MEVINYTVDTGIDLEASIRRFLKTLISTGQCTQADIDAVAQWRSRPGVPLEVAFAEHRKRSARRAALRSFWAMRRTLTLRAAVLRGRR